MTLLQYYLYTNIYLVLFWIVYRVFLKDVGLFRPVRLLLSGAILLSASLPFLHQSISLLAGSLEGADLLSSANLPVLNFIRTEPSIHTVNTVTSKLSQPESLIVILLLLGSILMVTINIFRHLKITKLIRRTRVFRHLPEGPSVSISREVKIPFIYQDLIVLPENMSEKERSMAIKHELFHYLYRHHLDNMLFAFFHPLFWMNPFFLIIRKELKLNHEYQVDQRILRTGNAPEVYQLSLVKYSVGIHRFSSATGLTGSNLKKRIKMMNRQGSHKGSWKSLLALPVLVSSVLVISLACNPTTKQESPENEPETAALTSRDSIDVELIDFNADNFPLPENDHAIVVLINRLSRIMINGDVSKTEDTREKIISEYMKFLEPPILTTINDERGKLTVINDINFRILVQKDLTTDSIAYAALLNDIGLALYQVRDTISNWTFSSNFNNLNEGERKGIERIFPMRIYTVLPSKNMTAQSSDR